MARCRLFGTFIERELEVVQWQGLLNNLRFLTQAEGDRPVHVPTNIISTEFWLVSRLDLLASVLIVGTNAGTKDAKSFWFISAAFILSLNSLYRATTAKKKFDRCGTVHTAYLNSWRGLRAAERRSHRNQG